MSKRDKGEPESGLKWLILALAGLVLIWLFNHNLLAPVHGKFLDPLYPYQDWYYLLTTPLFIKALYLSVTNSLPHDTSE